MRWRFELDLLNVPVGTSSMRNKMCMGLKIYVYVLCKFSFKFEF